MENKTATERLDINSIGGGFINIPEMIKIVKFTRRN